VEVHDGDLREEWRIVAACEADVAQRLISGEDQLHPDSRASAPIRA
jgi:hypothetical protein